MLKDIFGFAEYQEIATYGLGYTLTITKNVDNALLNKGNAIIIAIAKINSLELCLPKYTPSISNQAMLFKQIVSKVLQNFNM